MIKISVDKSARLPFHIIRGSEASRYKKAKEYTKYFGKELDKVCNSDTCSVEDFKNAIHKTLKCENYIQLYILPKKSTIYKASISREVSVKSVEGDYIVNVKGYKFFLPLNIKQDAIMDKYVAYHEVSHFMDYIFNPKQSSLRVLKLYEKQDLYSKIMDINKLFMENLSQPIKMKDFKKEVLNRLKSIPNDVQVDLFQTIRNSLKTEINAWNNEMKYSFYDSFENFGKVLEAQDFLTKYAKFNKKLKFVNKLLAQKLKEMRKENIK